MIASQAEREKKFYERLCKLDDADKEGKYCWAQLVYLTFNYTPGKDRTEQKEQARTGAKCREDSKREGLCWYHKFVDGELNQGGKVVYER